MPLFKYFTVWPVAHVIIEANGGYGYIGILMFLNSKSSDFEWLACGQYILRRLATLKTPSTRLVHGNFSPLDIFSPLLGAC